MSPIPPPPPLEYDPASGTYRSISRFSAPKTLLWVIECMLIAIGVAGLESGGPSWPAWVAAAVLGAALVATEWWSARRRRAPRSEDVHR